ncbi:hypothetical protein DB347_11630 [Opitutaceae bacterium EW11]|nr:hypothetical protein DB347_11630 [Opitutaceae bacterium EW11]
MGYLIIIIAAIVLVPLVYLIFARRPGPSQQGEKPIGKPVMFTEPAADEATPDASATRKDTGEAQRRTPAA